jgi:GTP cyclohydrolase II
MTTLPPDATIRSRVALPITLRDGRSSTAWVHTFEGLVDGGEHIALELGSPPPTPINGDLPRPPLVRLHSECLTGDVFGSQRCDCGPQLDEALSRIDRAGGYLLYLRQEGRGIGLLAKLDAYKLQDAGLDTYEANVALGFPPDERDYTVAAQMLHALGVPRIDLLSNNPDKAQQLRDLGISVARKVPTGVHLSVANAGYLATKVARGEHTIDLPGAIGETGA